MTSLCAICAEREAAPVICTRCTGRIRRDLDTVGKMRAMLNPSPGRTGSRGRASGKPGSKPPADLGVIAMTDTRSHFGWYHCGHDPDDEPCTDPRCGGEPDPDNVVNVDADLLTEARLVIEARRLHPPMRDAFDSIRVLNIHFDWIIRSPRVDEFAAIIAGCAVALRRAVHDQPDPVVGACPAKHPEREQCGGPLRFDYRGPLSPSPEHHATPTHVVCSWCRDETLVDAYLWQVMRALPAHARIPVTREWVVATWDINPVTLRSWIQRGHVRTFTDRSVDLIDVLTRLSETQQAG